jgi:hypothetical protein
MTSKTKAQLGSGFCAGDFSGISEKLVGPLRVALQYADAVLAERLHLVVALSVFSTAESGTAMPAATALLPQPVQTIWRGLPLAGLPRMIFIRPRAHWLWIQHGYLRNVWGHGVN